MPRLVKVLGTRDVDDHPVTHEMTFGRALACSVRIEDALTSRHHARIVETPRGWRIEDLRSMNGIRINDVPVLEEGAPLADQDLIQIGGAQFRFDLFHAARPRAAPEPEKHRICLPRRAGDEGTARSTAPPDDGDDGDHGDGGAGPAHAAMLLN